MTDRKRYITPGVMNLSGFGVLGSGFLGICSGGSNPTTYTCANGDRPEQTSMACRPTGHSPDLGGCKAGGNVANACTHGSMHVG